MRIDELTKNVNEMLTNKLIVKRVKLDFWFVSKEYINNIYFSGITYIFPWKSIKTFMSLSYIMYKVLAMLQLCNYDD